VTLAKELGKTCLLITHRIEDAVEMADRIIVLAAPRASGSNSGRTAAATLRRWRECAIKSRQFWQRLRPRKRPDRSID